MIDYSQEELKDLRTLRCTHSKRVCNLAIKIFMLSMLSYQTDDELFEIFNEESSAFIDGLFKPIRDKILKNGWEEPSICLGSLEDSFRLARCYYEINRG